MKEIYKHITFSIIVLLISLCGLNIANAQTPAGTSIDNSATVLFRYANGERDSVKSNLVSVIVQQPGKLILSKTAFPSRVIIGDTVSYRIIIRNFGPGPLSNIQVIDTLPLAVTFLSSTRGSISTSVFVWNIKFMDAGFTDTVFIIARVKAATLNETYIKNAAFGFDSQGDKVIDSVQVVATAIDYSCQMGVSVAPKVVIGNGISAAIISAYLSDTLGHPKPDGTPVYFNSSLNSSFFSNGKDTLTGYTKGGWIIDSLRALNAGDKVFTAHVFVSARDSNICSSFDSLDVVFYPGALKGLVINDDDDLPVKGAQIVVKTSSGDTVGNTLTNIDGRYLIMVPHSGSYRITITVKDTLNQVIPITTTANVTVPGTKGWEPVPQHNIASGTIYYYINRKPIPIPNIKLYLYRQSDGSGSTSVSSVLRKTVSIVSLSDSTFTDSLGVYEFLNPPKGVNTIVTADPTIRTSRTMHVPDSIGVYIINSNSPVIPNPNILLSKVGPANASTLDTVRYTISTRNSGALPISNTTIIDTLDVTMNFIRASGGAQWDSAAHRITWKIGKLDSLAATKTYSVDVTFNDTTSGSYNSINHVTITADEIYAISTKAQTKVVKANPSLSVVKTTSKYVQKDTVKADELFTYIIRLENNGNIHLTNVTLKDTIKLEHVVPISVENGQLDHNIVRWSKDTMEIGAVDTIKVLVQVNHDAQDGMQFTNVVYVNARETSKSAQVVVNVNNASNPHTVNPRLFLVKSASRGTVLVGDTVIYTIRLKNAGNITLTDIWIKDTLAENLIPLSALNASLNGHAVTRHYDSLVVSQIDSIIVKARIPIDRSNNEIILNRVFGRTSQTAPQDTSVSIQTHVLVPSSSCRIHLTPKPSAVLGDGKHASRITAWVIDTLGNPKPDGTPVYFTSPIGIFSNGLDSILVKTVGGYAIDSLTADVTGLGLGIVENYAKVTARDSDICAVTDSVKIIFYPGAIEGVVIDRYHDNKPIENVLVDVIGPEPGNTYHDTVYTGPDGSYLVPVPKEGWYSVSITTVDDFGNTNVTKSRIYVRLGTMTRNDNSITGKVYFIVSHKPIVARHVKVRLDRDTSAISLSKSSSADFNNLVVDTTVTDTSGFYSFRLDSSAIMQTKNYRILTTDPYFSGNIDVSNMLLGKYVINANIPIDLKPFIKLRKIGPSMAYAHDTVTYTILVRNDGNISIDSTVVTDSLDAAMHYVDAGAKRSMFIEHIGNRILWHVEHIDSLGGDSLWVKVRFADTLKAQTTVTNRVFVTSDKSSRIDTNTTTQVLLPELQIEKQALRKIIDIGDVETYRIKVTNNTPAMTLKNVQVSDYIPFGFKYIAGSTFIGNTKVTDPLVSKELRWTIADSLRPFSSVEFVYRLVAGAGSAEGNGINSAQAFAQTPSNHWIKSIFVNEHIEVRKGIFTDHGMIIGKIFYDNNTNAYQDPDEEGVKNVELVMEDGTRIVTGDDGKYSLPDVLPGMHVIKVRHHTLPKNSELIVGYNDFAGDPSSRFVDVTPSGIARADFYLRHVLPDTVALSQSIVKIGDLTIQRITQPRNLVFIEDEKPAPMKLTGLNFDVAKATLRPDAYPTLKQLAEILIDYPDITATIVGHTDSSPIHTREFPSNSELSYARANSVKRYLSEKEGIDSSRVKVLGCGEFKPIATNKTKEGKALNRRVEFFFGSEAEQGQRTTSTIVYKVPINYDGPVDLAKLEFTDVLDDRLQYVDGSAAMDDSTQIRPRQEGNKLYWTIDGIGNSFHKTLLYRVLIHQPEEKHIVLTSYMTAFKYSSRDSVITSDSMLQSTNEVAIALRGRAINYILSGVLFDVARSSLRSTAVSALGGAVDALKKDSTSTVLVEGHTDSNPIHTKEFSSNNELSAARAKTVAMKFVTEFGISPTRIRWIGFGSYRPVATNATSDGRQLNRRVEMRIFTKLFVESVIPDGLIDSSITERERFVPGIKYKTVDTNGICHVGEQFAITLQLRRPVSSRTAEVTLIDSLPGGLKMVESSVKCLAGIDTVQHSRVIIAKCSLNEPFSSVRFLGEITKEGEIRKLINHVFYVVRKENNGNIIVDKVKPIVIEVVKKNN